MANIAAECRQFFGIGVQTQRMFLGVVKPTLKKKATRVAVFHYEMDNWLNAYFRTERNYFAYDPDKSCKMGDLVLLKELPEKKSVLITHEIVKILFPLGDTTCPLTGRKVVVTKERTPQYRDNLEKIYEVYGKNPDRFVYEDAPPRGWQEGKRDFSDKFILPVWHDDDRLNRYRANLRI